MHLEAPAAQITPSRPSIARSILRTGEDSATSIRPSTRREISPSRIHRGQPALGYAAPQHPAQRVVRLEEHDLMTDEHELVGGGQPARPRADHGDALTGGRPRLPQRPAVVQGQLAHRGLEPLDAHRSPVHPPGGQDAARLARRVADAPHAGGQGVGADHQLPGAAGGAPLERAQPLAHRLLGAAAVLTGRGPHEPVGGGATATMTGPWTL